MLSKLRLALVFALLMGTGSVLARSEKPAPPPKDNDKHKPQTIGDVVSVTGLAPVLVEGVGLVKGLADTGSDPSPSVYRDILLNDMRKLNIPNPNTELASAQSSMVVVRGYIPPGAHAGDPMDVDVRVPANTQTTSLRGGWLLPMRLNETATYRDPKRPATGRMFDGKPRATAGGPVMVSPSFDGQADSALLLRGRVLGGAKVIHDRPLALKLAPDHKSVRTSQQVASRITQRFHAYGRNGLMKKMAVAKTDQFIELQVPERYRYNLPRYLRVIRRLPLYDSPATRRDKLEQLASQLEDPAASADAALELEGMNLNDAGPILKAALESPRASVRFYAAETLAYLGDPACAKELTAAARDNSAYRVYALTALAALDEAISHEALRELMDTVSAETRYGAFRALWAMDERDPLVRGEKLNDQFFLHLIDSQGPPMVHIARSYRPEITVFGGDQKLVAPLSLQAGPRVLVNAARDDQQVHLTHFSPNGRERKATASLAVADVIRKAVELGANYPDVVEMLAQAQRQRALDGRLEIDALPRPGRRDIHDSDQTAPDGSEEKPEPAGAVPNLFARTDTTPSPALNTETKQPGDKETPKSTETHRRVFGRLFGRHAN